jgi:C-terminal processing protease CtpA/Prc
MYRHRNRVVLAVLLYALLVTGNVRPATAQTYAESFDIVWTTINERFYDPEFKGVNWSESRERYRPQITNAQDDDRFYEIINHMLFELGVSHLGVVPTDDPKQLGEAAIFGEGTVGIDVRLVDGRLFITGVAGGSAAADAGLAVGYEVLSLNGRTLDDIATQPLEFPTPPFTERNERYMILGAVYRELLGPVSDKVAVEFRDHGGRVSQLSLDRRSRGAQRVFDEGMPPTYVTIESERIGDDIGYIRFNSFHPALIDDLQWGRARASRRNSGCRVLVYA